MHEQFDHELNYIYCHLVAPHFFLQEDYAALVKQLNEEMAKDKTDENTVMLLKESFPNRRLSLRSFKTRPMHSLIQFIPGFAKAPYVSVILQWNDMQSHAPAKIFVNNCILFLKTELNHICIR